MKAIEELKNFSDEELETIIKNRIEELEEETKERNGDNIVIGYNLDYKPEVPKIIDSKTYIPGSEKEHKLSNSCIHPGYVPIGTKIVYCIQEKNGVITNDGGYYYVDTDEYIYMFFKYIRDKEISDEKDLFIYIESFIMNYLGIIEEIPRKDMFKVICENEGKYYDRVEEHKFSWFKNKGNGMCTERALMAQNILSVLGFYSAIINGNITEKFQKTGDIYCDAAHTYNLVAYSDTETGETIQVLVDFSVSTWLYKYKVKELTIAPFIDELEDGINDSIEILVRGLKKDNLIDDKDKLTFNDYYCSIINGKLVKILVPAQREYSIKPFESEKPKKLTKI